MKNFSNSFVTVNYDGLNKILVIELKGFIPTQPYREGMEAVLQIAKSNRCSNWLFDVRTFEGAKPVDLEWVATEFFQRSQRELSAFTKQRRKSANLVAANVFAAFQVQQAVKKIEDQKNEVIDIMTFGDKQKAIEFLTSTGN